MEFVATFIVFLVVTACLALGVLVGREPLRGSCGGSACANCRGTGQCRKANQGSAPHD